VISTVSAAANLPTLVGAGVVLNNAVVLNSSLQLGDPQLFSSRALGDTTATSPTSFTHLALNGVISGSGGLVINGIAVLNGANSYSGGTLWTGGALGLGTDSALGSGTLTLNSTGGTGVFALVVDGPRNLANRVIVTPGADAILAVDGAGTLTLSNAVQLDGGQLYVQVGNYRLTFGGSVVGAGGLNAMGGTVIVSGSNSYTGGTFADTGKLIFASAGAMPNNGGLEAQDGYIGLAIPAGTANVQTSFINRFNKTSTAGTIGFDTLSGSPTPLNEAIDLTGFDGNARLGSATSAVLGGVITPQGSDYNFGGGGGTLTIGSSLSDFSVASGGATRNVEVWSDDANLPLTLVLAGVNTYTGETWVADSALIFATSAALGQTSNLHADAGGFIGLALSSNSTGSTPAVTDFLSRFDNVAAGGFLGFEANGAGNNTITDLDLSASPFANAGIATTSTTPVHVAGNLTLAGGAANYRFAGYKGGQLVVDSVLSGARGIIIGDTSVPATMAAINDAIGSISMSSVTLNGANTITGDTQLDGGNLFVGNSGALGSGTLRVASGVGDESLNVRPGFFTTQALTIPNAIVASSGLNLGGDSNMTLTGTLSGGAQLYKTGLGTLTLAPAAGTNAIEALYVQAGSVVFGSGSAIGGTSLQFGPAPGLSATFLDSGVVNGLSADNASAVINLTAGKTLTVNQTFDATFLGSITGNTGGLVLQGGHLLQLAGASSFAGPVTIQGNTTVVAAHNNAFGASSNAVTVSNAKLALSSGVTVANPMTLTNAILAGTGTFKAATSAFDISSGTKLSPGNSSAGTLSFDGSLLSTSALILGGGGYYRWDLVDASSGWDRVAVNGIVTISATSAAPFNFSLNSIAPDGSTGFAANFDPTRAYSWTVLTASTLNGFTDANQFAIDAHSFLNLNGGQFSLTASGTALTLNFTPVPEPSTYVLMLVGLGLTGLAIRRRRQRA